MSLTLTDIDALTLACRDPRSRQYITEATACHRAGANRAAIVMAWIAVVFDLLHKLKELELASDPEATRLVAVFEKARMQGDISTALAFERDLVLSIGKFELLSPSELVDIERMREDRNRCGHPSMTTDDDAYQPTPELARTQKREGPF